MKKKLTFVLLFILIFSFVPGCNSINPGDILDSLVDRVLGREESPVVTEPGTSDPSYAGQLKVHFIDVGQGDAIFIETPSHNILIDGGERGNTVLNYLEEQNVEELHLVIGTHPHADHIGGLINVIEAIPVKEVIDSGAVHTTKTFEDYLKVIDKKEIKYTEGRAGMARHLGSGVSMQVMHPASVSSSNLNDSSIVIKLTFGKVSFLFTGNAEEASENSMLNRRYNLRSTILKVGHYGSSTSTTESFLNAVKPEAAVIMVGENNEYGFPHQETLARLANADVDIYMTSVHGTIIITTDGQSYDINVDEPYQYIPEIESDSEAEEEEDEED